MVMETSVFVVRWFPASLVSHNFPLTKDSLSSEVKLQGAGDQRTGTCMFGITSCQKKKKKIQGYDYKGAVQNSTALVKEIVV